MENNKNDFDDIILEKSNKSEKIKKILLRIIALVILFLAVMIVMKLINSNDEKSSQDQLLIPSEPVSSENTSNDFEGVPITENSPATDDTSAEEQFNLLKQQLQGEDNGTQTQSTSQQNPIFPANEEPTFPENIEPTPPSAQTATANENTPAPQPQSAAKPEAKQTQKSETKQTKKPEAKKEAPKEQKTDTKELFENVNAQPVNPNGLASGIYVQIFSVTNLDQKSKELAAVKQKGYDYKLYKTTVNGKEITKVLIGPFEKTTIANELAKIRQNIAKDAFSFTLK